MKEQDRATVAELAGGQRIFRAAMATVFLLVWLLVGLGVLRAEGQENHLAIMLAGAYCFIFLWRGILHITFGQILCVSNTEMRLEPLRKWRIRKLIGILEIASAIVSPFASFHIISSGLSVRLAILFLLPIIFEIASLMLRGKSATWPLIAEVPDIAIRFEVRGRWNNETVSK